VKTLSTAAVVALLAFALVACGGGDDETTGATTTATTTTEGATTAPKADGGGGNEKQAGDDSEGDDSSSGGNSSAGEGSAAFRTPGGDNSIQNFGEEADADQLEAAEAALVAYLDARADGDWKASCEYLAEAATQPLEQLAESSPKLKGKSCAAIIGALSAQIPSSSRANPVVEGVASLRVEDDRAFALFHGPEGADFFVPMVEEDGEWKVGALAPSEFP
jgi:hypothetical protein